MTQHIDSDQKIKALNHGIYIKLFSDFKKSIEKIL
jgi:hypothetical protein